MNKRLLLISWLGVLGLVACADEGLPVEQGPRQEADLVDETSKPDALDDVEGELSLIHI